MPRLKLLGVDAETIAENLVAVINQRLVRRICPHCATPRVASDDERRWLDPASADETLRVLWEGLPPLPQHRLSGRLPVYELLAVNRDLADAIASDARRAEMRQRAQTVGMRPILALARHRVLAGETTMEEILRTVGEDWPHRRNLYMAHLNTYYYRVLLPHGAVRSGLLRLAVQRDLSARMRLEEQKQTAPWSGSGASRSGWRLSPTCCCTCFAIRCAVMTFAGFLRDMGLMMRAGVQHLTH